MKRFTMKFAVFFAILLAVGSMGLARPAGAQTTAAAVPAVTPPLSAGSATSSHSTLPGYRLGTGDKVRLTVFGEPDLSGEFEVDGSGFLRLNLVGQVMALGLTVEELERNVKAALEDGYLKDARVSVEVINYRPFYIIGEVNRPGEYPYSNDMTILNAVAKAGGYTYRANESNVFIRRNGDTKEIPAPADQTTKINPGDVIRIPERFF